MQKLVFDPEQGAWFVGTETSEGTIFNDGDELSPAGIASGRFDYYDVKEALELAIRGLEAVSP